MYGPPFGDAPPSLFDREMPTEAQAYDDRFDTPMDVDDARPPAMSESISQSLFGIPAPPPITVNSNIRLSFPPPIYDDGDLYASPSKSNALPIKQPDVSGVFLGLSNTQKEAQPCEITPRRPRPTLSLTDRQGPALIQSRHADIWNTSMLPKEISVTHGRKIKFRARIRQDCDRTRTLFDFTLSEWAQQRGAIGKHQ